MRLGTKATLVIAVTLSLTVVATFWVAGDALIEDYKDLEEREMDAEAGQMLALLDDEVDRTREATRQFIEVGLALSQGGNATDNETLGVLISILATGDIRDALMIFDGQPYGFSIGPTGFEDMDPALNATLVDVANGIVFDAAGLASGLVATDTSVMVVGAVAQPIPQFNGTITLLGARPVDAAFQERLAQRTGYPIRLLIGMQDRLALDRHSWDDMTVLVPVPTLDGSGVHAAMDVERITFREAIDSITFFFVATLIVAAVVLVAGSLSLRWLVTGRVRRLSRAMLDIGATGDLSRRVEEHGNDEVASLAGAFNDLLGNLAASEQALRAANAELDAFARGVAHDLKSPLSTFALSLASVQRKAPEAAPEAVARMGRGIKDMERRIDLMLAYAQGMQDDPVPVAAQEAAADALASLEGLIQQTNAQLRVEPLPVVMSQMAPLQSVFQNLLSNAMKYSLPGEAPQVRVWAEQRPGWARIHVEDRGRGFDPAEADKILHPFARLSNSGDQAGHGVGLATVRRIVERFGGSVEAHGALGHGARFTFTLRRPEA